jgi:hypothetical protein
MDRFPDLSYRRTRPDFPHTSGHDPVDMVDDSACVVSHPDFTQELPRKLLPTRAKEAQRGRREKR